MRDRNQGANSSKPGKVFLVGAGPGDPELITVRGVACLRQADVAVYDYLVSRDLLDYLPPSAERIFAGKLAGDHFLKQDDINRLLIRKAKEGKCVVRLKGGDPFVFGRGGEECLALLNAGVLFEVVPGISAAVGASAYAGIPVTHRGYASSLYLVTAHLRSKDAELNINWEQLARAGDTLCIYMGMRILPEITGQLQRHGCKPDTPVAIIQWGTHPQQRTVTGTLRDIAGKASAAGLTRPGLIIVGEVVRLRDQLNWFERGPLFGRRIVIAGTPEQAEEMLFRFRALGAEAIQLPPVEIVPPDGWKDLDRAINRLGTYDGLVLPGPSAVRFFLGRLEELGHDVRRLANVRVCAAGEGTARALEYYHLRADVVPEDTTAESLATGLAAVEDLRGTKWLVPHAAGVQGEVPDALKKHGAVVDPVAVYRIVPVEATKEKQRTLLEERPVDWVVFASPSTVSDFLDYVQPIMGADWIRHVGLAAMGPTTSNTLRERGLEPALESSTPGGLALVDAIAQHELRTSIEAERDSRGH